MNKALTRRYSRSLTLRLIFSLAMKMKKIKMRTLLILILFVVPSSFVYANESSYVLDVQYATDSNNNFHVIGEVTKESIASYLEKFPWLEQPRIAVREKKTSPTVSVKNTSIDRYLSASIVGVPADYVFLIFYGKISQQSEPLILQVKGQENMKRFFIKFLSGESTNLDKFFNEKGLTPKKYFK